MSGGNVISDSSQVIEL